MIYCAYWKLCQVVSQDYDWSESSDCFTPPKHNYQPIRSIKPAAKATNVVAGKAAKCSYNQEGQMQLKPKQLNVVEGKSGKYSDKQRVRNA